MQFKYHSPQNEKEISFINISELQKASGRIIPRDSFDYIRSGAGDEITMQRNTTSFNTKEIYPRTFAGIKTPDLHTSVLGIPINLPIITAPMAAHGLAHISAESGTAKGTAAAGSIMSISTYSNQTLEKIAAAGNGAPQWFQLYLSKDDGFNRHLLEEAVKNNIKAIILTVDATINGNREADMRNRFTMPLPLANLKKTGQNKALSLEQIFDNFLPNITLKDLSKIISFSKLPLIVKGIQNPQDALQAVSAGASAIWVSNHGGRQLDGGPASFEVLEEIAAAVNHRVPIIFDSGIRRGQHIFKALASGADITAIGRPLLYGLAQGGWRGVKDVYDFFARELSMVMQLAGTPDIEAVKKAPLFTAH